MTEKCTSINPEILSWARESAGYSLEDVCAFSSLKKYSEWENGRDFPTYTQLEIIASKFKRPLAIFFFPEIPKEITPKKSFRTIPEYELDLLSPTINFLFRKGLSMQENLKELKENQNTDYINFIEQIGDIDRFDSSILTKIRALLGISFETQFETNSREDMFEMWRNAFADNGIYVFKEAFKDDNVGGFCLYDEMYPVIFINNSTTKNRQIFTLFHELAHLLLKGNHVDLADRDYVEHLPNDSKSVEIVCNKFAGDFLVPNRLFNQMIAGKRINEAFIEQLANKFVVSQEVIARKLLDKNIITNAYYNKIANILKEAVQKNTSGKGHYYYSQIAYLGKRYVELILDKYNSSAISFEQAVDYSGIKAKNFGKLESFYIKTVYGGAF
ncbi:MAG: XRE family transcriptional regulator [bacterium]|nr:XRE family transcriptional regulator [bacterium]